jgi:uncharacterized integral membrane protein
MAAVKHTLKVKVKRTLTPRILHASQAHWAVLTYRYVLLLLLLLSLKQNKRKDVLSFLFRHQRAAFP